MRKIIPALVLLSLELSAMEKHQKTYLDLFPHDLLASICMRVILSNPEQCDSLIEQFRKKLSGQQVDDLKVFKLHLNSHYFKNETDIPLRIRIRKDRNDGQILFDETIEPLGLKIRDLTQVALNKNKKPPKWLRFTPMDPQTNQEIKAKKYVIGVMNNHITFVKEHEVLTWRSRKKTMQDFRRAKNVLTDTLQVDTSNKKPPRKKFKKDVQ